MTKAISNGVILIIEDEVELAEIFKDYLVQSGFHVEILNSGLNAIELVEKLSPDLILLDLMMPDKSGISICKQIRKTSLVPIIMITAKVSEVDRIWGLEVGADDYICKPAKPREVVARVKATLRRTYNLFHDKKPLNVVENQQRAYWHDQLIDLTPIEFRLLQLLSRNTECINSREFLMTALYSDNRYVCDRTIDSHIKNLRKKLADVSKLKNPIRSIYGVGYRLELL